MTSIVVLGAVRVKANCIASISHTRTHIIVTLFLLENSTAASIAGGKKRERQIYEKDNR